MEWIYPVITLLSLIVAVLAATNKLIWAKEYRDAKDETIKAKEALIELLRNEIQNLRDFTSVKIRESFLSMKQQLEEYITKLQQELAGKNQELSELQRSGQDGATEVKRLTDERVMLENKIQKLERVVEDEFISDLIERSFFGFDLRLKGEARVISTFLERASQLGESKGSVSRPLNDHHVVNLTYAHAVPRDEIERLIFELGLEVIEFKSVRGINF